MNKDMNCGIKMEVKQEEIIPSPKYLLKNKIEKRILMSVDKEDHVAPLDLSDKSKLKREPHGHREVTSEYHVPQHLYQTPINKVVNQRHLSTALVSSPFNRVRGPVQRLANLHIAPSAPLHNVPSAPLHMTPSSSLPREIVIPHVIPSPQVIRSTSYTINPDALDNVVYQQLSRSNSYQEDLDDPSSPNSNSSQTHSYSEEELMRYPKGPLRRQRILQNSLSEEERTLRERFINNESSRRYRQRKHLAQKNVKDQEEILIAKQALLKDQFVKLKHESELYYSYFKRTYF